MFTYYLHLRIPHVEEGTPFVGCRLTRRKLYHASEATPAHFGIPDMAGLDAELANLAWFTLARSPNVFVLMLPCTSPRGIFTVRLTPSKV